MYYNVLLLWTDLIIHYNHDNNTIYDTKIQIICNTKTKDHAHDAIIIIYNNNNSNNNNNDSNRDNNNTMLSISLPTL